MPEPTPDTASPASPSSPTKRVVDAVNSIAWFAMDASWMCKLEWPAYAFVAVTVMTGLWLLALGRRDGRSELFADLGLNCWIAMNAVWLVADPNGQPTPYEIAVPLAVVGGVLLGIASWLSQDVRRLRIRVQ